MKTIKVDYHGFEGQGTTVKEAKADADRKVKQFVKDMMHGPTVIQGKDNEYLIIVYRVGENWGRRIYCEGISGAESWGRQSKAESVRSAKYHIAQTLSTIENVRTDICEPDDKNELIRYFEWQRRWKEFKAQGYDDNECHKLASGWTIEQVRA